MILEPDRTVLYHPEIVVAVCIERCLPTPNPSQEGNLRLRRQNPHP